MRSRKPKYNGTQRAILVCFFSLVIVSVTLTVLLLSKAFHMTRNADEGELPKTLTEVLPGVGVSSDGDRDDDGDSTVGVEDAGTDENVGSEEAETSLPEEVTDGGEDEEITEESRVLAVQPEEWELMLVNPWNPIPRDYEVELIELSNGHSVDKRAYPDLQDMMDDARAEGLYPIICSSYRTNQRQRELFKNQVDKYVAAGMTAEEAEIEAAKWVAIPGTSEHQTGLAVDIVALDYQILDEGQEDTPEQKWLMENSYRYGFILRFPTDKSDVTGIHYEPWHYRYVGKEAAAEMYSKGVCLEEYLMDRQ